MMRTQCLLGLRTFVAFAAKLWSFFIYLLRRQIRTVSLGGCWRWWGPLSAVLKKKCWASWCRKGVLAGGFSR